MRNVWLALTASLREAWITSQDIEDKRKGVLFYEDAIYLTMLSGLYLISLKTKK